MKIDEDTVYVPRVVDYDHDEPLDIEGNVIAVLRESRSRRATVLVEEPAAEHLSDEPDNSLQDVGYRELQIRAKEHNIAANQSADELRGALRRTNNKP